MSILLIYLIGAFLTFRRLCKWARDSWDRKRRDYAAGRRYVPHDEADEIWGVAFGTLFWPILIVWYLCDKFYNRFTIVQKLIDHLGRIVRRIFVAK